ncbi:hypothetical protein [Paenibacillus sp. FJAT-26967]|uniref:hypothetical protein n=1 Tax=Paenibacillus sp. FJAT-26967 TaxID=1729690 RepID=UPI000ACB5BE5|nr:hypothetical protein [Paenibacillus sp. FJAT-26967]
MMIKVPKYLFHYYEKSNGAFTSLSSLTLIEAEEVLKNIRQKNESFASKRADNYVGVRFELESKIRQCFILKGGEPKTKFPHYMTLGSCDWLKEWYKEGDSVQIPLSILNPKSISFTYGDSFPAMRVQDGKPYRGQVYTFEELPGLIEKYGLPQNWNFDGKFAPERYIEAQVWDDEVLNIIL